MRWTPLLTETADIAPARAKLQEIAIALETEGFKMESIGLMNGRTGVALFFFYYARLTGRHYYMELGQRLLEEVFHEIDNREVPHSFCSGLAGVGWTLEFLANAGFIKDEPNDLLTELDVFLSEKLREDLEGGYLDFLHGALGYGNYFLSRCKNGGTVAEKMTGELREGLQRLGKHTPEELTWESVINTETGVMGVNLGLAHGMPSYLVFLAKTAAAGLEPDKCLDMIERATTFLLHQKRNPREFGSTFPGWLSQEHPSGKSRLAWCYGDAGIGAALWLTGLLTGNEPLQSTARDILLAASIRRNPTEAGVGDAGICHGAAGLAHIYNRALHFPGAPPPQLRDTATFWWKETLRMAYYNDGVAGYKSWSVHRGWQNETDLLTGVSGVGLMLISAISDIPPDWDAALLLS